MPRRISDYPDAFAGWNLVSSFGSLVSVIATFIFLDLLYKQLTTGLESSRYPWLTPQFHSDILRAMLERAYSSLEWGLNSPPKPHSFVSLPLQSFHSSFLLLSPSRSDLVAQINEARQRAAAEDAETRRLSDIYTAAAEKVENVVGTPEEAQARLDAASALSDYEFMSAQCTNTMQYVTELMILLAS